MSIALHKHVTHPLDENIKLINIYINIKYKTYIIQKLIKKRI